MAQADIIDLDALVGPPKKVKLAGEVYKLPADLPADLFLKVSTYADSELSESELIEDLYEELLGLFQVHQPKLDALPIGVAQMILAIPQIYVAADAKPEGGARPSRAGTRSTSRKRSTKSRSTKS